MEERMEIEYGQSDLLDYQRQILETGIRDYSCRFPFCR